MHKTKSSGDDPNLVQTILCRIIPERSKKRTTQSKRNINETKPSCFHTPVVRPSFTKSKLMKCDEQTMEQRLGWNEVSRPTANNHFSLKAGFDGNLWPVVESHLLTQHTGIARGALLYFLAILRFEPLTKYFDAHVIRHTPLAPSVGKSSYHSGIQSRIFTNDHGTKSKAKTQNKRKKKIRQRWVL